MRNEYVTPFQGNFVARGDYLIHEIDATATTSALNKLQKQLDILKKKQAELAAFDDLLRHYSDQLIRGLILMTVSMSIMESMKIYRTGTLMNSLTRVLVRNLLDYYYKKMARFPEKVIFFRSNK